MGVELGVKVGVELGVKVGVDLGEGGDGVEMVWEWSWV